MASTEQNSAVQRSEKGVSDFEVSTNEETNVVQERYVWKSRSEHLTISLGYTIGLDAFYSFVSLNGEEKSVDEPNIIHELIIFYTFGLPLLFMESFMGQFSQLGCLQLGKLAPIVHGVGASMLCISIHQCVLDSVDFADCIYYLARSMSTKLPWMKCPDSDKDCLDYETMEKCHTQDECFQGSVENFSTYLYHTKVVADSTLEWTGFGHILWHRIVFMVLVWLLTSVCTLKGVDWYKHMVRATLILSFILVVILTLWVGLNHGAVQGLTRMFFVTGQSFLQIKSWLTAVANCFVRLDVSQAGHILFGSYLPPGYHSVVDSILICTINIMASIVGASFSYVVIGVLSKTIKENVDTMKLKDWEVIYSLIPQVLGSLRFSQFFTALFFILCSILVLNNQVTQVDVISESIIETFPSIRVHRNYIVLFTCGLALLLSFTFAFAGNQPIRSMIEADVLSILSLIVLFLEATAVMYLYGVQRFSDDIHFLLGAQPVLYWKLCWSLMPVLLGAAIVFNVFAEVETTKKKSYSLEVITIILFLINLTPLVVGALYKVFKYLKYHHLVGLIKAEPSWGPRNPIERKIRCIFNPRQEIRSRRRMDVCQHHCLINSTTLNYHVAQEEMSYISMELEGVGLGYETSEEGNTEENG